MQTYDILMLLVLVAAALWGYWKGFVWQLASLASIFFSYFLAFGLRVQVARLIDAEPPWNMFAAMGIVYLLASLVIWIGTAFSSALLESIKLKDFDRQLGATFGIAKGVIFCVLITFFAVTLLGPREQARICGSTSGRYIARLLRSSGGLIPKEVQVVVDPYLRPFQEKLEEHHPPATEFAESGAPTNAWGVGDWPAPATMEQGGAPWPVPYAPPVAGPNYSYGQPAYPPGYGYPPPGYPPQPYYPPPAYATPAYPGAAYPGAAYPAPQYPPPAYAPAPYDPRYAPPSYRPPVHDERVAPAPYGPSTSYPYDPRWTDPRSFAPAADPRYPTAPPTQPYAQQPAAPWPTPPAAWR